MKAFVFDIEGNSLNPDKIWCLAAYNLEHNHLKSSTSYEDMKKLLLNADVLIGHNIARFDIPVLERILDIKIEAKIVDTLALSWYLYPNRIRYGLEEWGEELGVKKPPIIDWNDPNMIDEYIVRCEEDVKINTLLWRKMLDKLKCIYHNEVKMWEFIDYISFKMDCAREQERSGWKLDIQLCKTSLEELEVKKSEAVDKLTEVMPPIPVIKKKDRPSKPFKRDGSISSTGASWLHLLKQQGYDIAPDQIATQGPTTLEYVDSYKEGNPASPQQVKYWLTSCGWRPETFKHVRADDGIRKIPQINLEHGGGICPSIKKLYSKHPEFELLEGLGVISHRISILKGFLDSVDERGYIKAQVAGLTNTLRFKHKTIVNLPKVGKPYGDIMRGVLTSPDGYELCGSDMSSLEDRLKQHYIYPFDPDYVNEMLADDFDPHLSLALLAGSITQQQMDDYKSGVDKSIKPIRDIFKNGNYACQYGAGPARLALTANITEKEAKKVHKAYWDKNWAIDKVSESQNIVHYKDEMWLINPISGFAYSLRNMKDVFSTLVQGSAVYVFDLWIKQIRTKRPQLTGQFHDEIVLCVKQGNRDSCEKLLRDSIEVINKRLKLNRELGVDVQFGSRYSEIH